MSKDESSQFQWAGIGDTQLVRGFKKPSSCSRTVLAAFHLPVSVYDEDRKEKLKLTYTLLVHFKH